MTKQSEQFQLTNRLAVSAQKLCHVLIVVVLVTVVTFMQFEHVMGQFDNVGGIFPDSIDFENSQMLIQADELEFDNDQNTISAVGNVDISLGEYNLKADQIMLDRSTSRMVAEGNIELTSPDGTVITANSLNLSEDFSNGFIYSLRALSAQRTVISAEKVEKINEQVLSFENATYSPYYTNQSKFPPFWRLKSVKIVQDKNIELIVLDDVRLELFGLPVVYLPKFVLVDSNSSKGSGLLVPNYYYNDIHGYTLVAPYYVSLAPNYDTTVTTALMTRQGILLDFEWRHLLEDVSYSMGVAGISQQDPKVYFENLNSEIHRSNSADRTFRGAVRTNGNIQLNPLWRLGWNYSLLSDRRFPHDYGTANVGHYGHDSIIFLRGDYENNYFDAAIYNLRVSNDPFYCLVKYNCRYRLIPSAEPKEFEIDPQDFQPIIRPVIEYVYFTDQPIFGGDVSLVSNLTSLHRSLTEVNSSIENKYFYPGYSGNQTRFSMKGNWKRQLIDRFGQVFTPFAYSKIDMFLLSQLETDELEHLTKDSLSFRVMPAVGINYSFPFVSSYQWGTQLISPVGQLIVRPNETGIGEFPNNDSHSIVFETSNLFEHDKFTGFDRTEGGTRLNLGFRHILQFNDGSALNSLFGQSLHVAGMNSYRESDLTHPFVGASLNESISDYVTSHLVDTNFGLQLGASNWIDKDDFRLNRTDLVTTGFLGPIVGSAKYSYLRTNSESGKKRHQEGQLATGIKIQDNWRLYGSMRFDIEENVNLSSLIGLGYDDEGISISATFGEENNRSGELINRFIKFNISPRTLGEIDLEQIQNLGLLDYNLLDLDLL